MAHTFGQNTAHTNGGTGNPVTFSFTPVEYDTVLSLLIKVRGTVIRTGGAPTWNGITFTQASTSQIAASLPEVSAEQWYIDYGVLLAHGFHDFPLVTANISIPNAGGLTIFHMAATGRAARGGRSQFKGAAGANATATNPTPTVVATVPVGSIGFAVVASGATTWAPSARVGVQLNDTDDGADGTGRQYHLPASFGNQTLSWTFGTSDDYGAVSAYFQEIPPHKVNNLFDVKCGGNAGILCVGVG